jgi:DtxR family Mn-dependent transcriptional regulator
MGRLASIMRVVPGTATVMVKTLADSGLVDYEPRSGVKLTTGGEQLALHVLRRHRLVEMFLVKVLGLDWSEVHEEAEELEHVISERVLERIDRVLGRPPVDPHGDPIPTAKGRMASQDLLSLWDAAPGGKVRIVRIVDQDAMFLQFLDRSKLTPGTTISIELKDDVGQTLAVRPQRHGQVVLARAAADKILVTWLKQPGSRRSSGHPPGASHPGTSPAPR